MNDSDNNDTFSNTPNEDWIENDKTNLLSDTPKEEIGKFVEEISMPFKEEEEEIQNQEEIEEIMNTDNIIENLEDGVLEEELKHEILETEMAQLDELEEEEVGNEDNLNESESFLEDLTNNEKEETGIEENFLKEEIVETQNEGRQENDEIMLDSNFETETEVEAEFEEEKEEEFIDFNQEVLNGTQNDMLASIENIEMNQVDFITDEEIDLDRDFTDIEDNDVFIEESSAFINEEVNEEDMFRKPNFFFAIFGGLAAILASSLFWAESASLLDKYYNYDHKYAYMALLVGICVGLGIRWAGRGKTYGFGILAVLLTLCGSLSGTLLSTLVHVVEAFDVSYFDIFEIFDFSFLYGLLEDRYQNLDLAFYVSACILAYWIAVRKEKK